MANQTDVNVAKNLRQGTCCERRSTTLYKKQRSNRKCENKPVNNSEMAIKPITGPFRVKEFDQITAPFRNPPPFPQSLLSQIPQMPPPQLTEDQIKASKPPPACPESSHHLKKAVETIKNHIWKKLEDYF